MKHHPDEEFELECILRKIEQGNYETETNVELPGVKRKTRASQYHFTVSHEGVRMVFIGYVPKDTAPLSDYVHMMEPGVRLVFAMRPGTEIEKYSFTLSFMRSFNGNDAYIKRVEDNDSPSRKDRTPTVTKGTGDAI